MTVTTLLVVVAGALLPYSPLATPLGLAPLPASYFAFLAAVVVSYLAIVELVKHRLLSARRAQ